MYGKKGYKGKRKSKRSRKHRGRMYQAIKRGVKKALLKYTDVKISQKVNQWNPGLANYNAGNTIYCPIDPPMSLGSTSARQKEVSNNWWGQAGNVKGYDLFANVPFLIGNTIKRTSFKIRLHYYADWWTGNAAPYTYQVNTQTPSNEFSGRQCESRFRMSIVRAQRNISDDDLEVYMGNLGGASFEDQWNPSYVNVLYDKFMSCTAPGAGFKRFSVHKTIKFRGKRGSQRLNLPIVDSNGALASNFCQTGKLYFVIRQYYYSYVNQNVTWQLLPYFDKIEFITKYIDI